MDEKLKKTLDLIKVLAAKNKDFEAELQKLYGGTSSANTVLMDNVDIKDPISTGNDKIDSIYELCVEKVLQEQAEQFYKDFPIEDLKDTLVHDYVRMEGFHRKDNFGDFCLALYQQIEGITNYLCNDSRLNSITKSMWTCSAYVKSEKDKEPKLNVRTGGDYKIANLVFPGINKNTGVSFALEKSSVDLSKQYAYDKMRIIIYFLGYKAMFVSADYSYYLDITDMFYKIYQCRNLNHRGNETSISEDIQKILSNRSFYYFKFLGALSLYVNYVKKGYPLISELEEYANSLTIGVVKNKLVQPKVVGYIDPSTFAQTKNK